MFESFIVTSRETLEASLVVGIVLAYLNKTDNNQYKKSVYWGITIGIVVSLLSAFLFTTLAGGFEGTAEALFEGITMLVGASLLVTMILWMKKQRNITAHIHKQVKTHIEKQNSFSHIGILLLIAIAIIREGVETVIFLNAINYANGVSLFGGVLGVVSAIFIGVLFFLSTKKINLKRLFTISSVLLILFAAGLYAHGVHELQEASVIPELVAPLFDINPAINPDGSYPLLHENGIIGSFLKGLFGYNGNPTLLEVLTYVISLGAILFFFFKNAPTITQKRTSS